MLADIGVRPSVEPAFLHADKIIGWQPVTKTIALLYQRIEIAAFRVECERRRVTHAGGKGCLIGAVCIEALDGRLRLRLDSEIARRAYTDEQCASLRINHEVTVLVALNDSKHALFGDHLGAVGTRRRLTLIGRHFINALCLTSAGTKSTEDVRHAPNAI